MNGSLYLTPENALCKFSDLNALRSALLDIGLIRDGRGDADTYLCGNQFAQLITFMGCSPHLVFEPPDDSSSNYCHINLQVHDKIQILTGQQTAPPRCPACRYRIADWRNFINASSNFENQPPWHCPQCNETSPLYLLDWRQSGGSGKIFIKINNIFPGEAVPVERLLATLKTVSAEKWRYFYLV